MTALLIVQITLPLAAALTAGWLLGRHKAVQEAAAIDDPKRSANMREALLMLSENYLIGAIVAWAVGLVALTIHLT